MNSRIKFISLSIILLVSLSAKVHGQTKILFDGMKAESAGNADWVIDADVWNIDWYPNAVVGTGTFYTASNAQRIPTPAQSGVTASTPETYWKGALSSWAIDCVNKGYTVETLPWNGQITYGNTSNAQDLSNYKVYIVDEPNIMFTTAEKTALMQFVQNGGGLFMISDHTMSDRNSDGKDSPHIWDDFLSTNSVQPYPFGIFFDTVDFSQTSTNISAASTDSIIHGPMGNVVKVQWNGGTTMTLNPAQNASVKGVVFKTGTTPGNTNAMVAYARYGSGKVAAIGDSSPADDSTGNNANCTLYNGYWADAGGNHRTLLMNATIWLATTDAISHVGIGDLHGANGSVTVYPNPSNGVINVSTDSRLINSSINIYNFTGQIVAQKVINEFDKGDNVSFSLTPGMYIVKVSSDEGVQTSRFTVY